MKINTETITVFSSPITARYAYRLTYDIGEVVMATSESGIIRERARRSAKRITDAWSELPDFPLNLDDTASAEVNLAAVEDDLTDLRTSLEFAHTQLNVLYECHQN